jgi:hypothetical protein
MAVASVLDAGLFVLVLIAYGVYAVLGKRPLIAPELLILAVIAWVLSFAGRRIIRNSEGTRTGESLTNAAWWIAIVVGLGYATYLLAINYTIRRDADGEVQRWVGLILKDDITGAFHRTIEPGRRAAIPPDDATKMRLEFRDQFVGFQQSDIVRVAQRNPGECEFIPGGLRDWNYRRTGIECGVTGTLRCKEGLFPLLIPLRAVEGGGAEGATGRQWQIIIMPNGFAQRDRITLTPYGWQVVAVEKSCDEVARKFLQESMTGPAPRLQAVARYTNLLGVKELTESLLPFAPGAAEARIAAVGGTAVGWTPPPATITATARALFSLPGGQKPSEEKGKQFEEVWRTTGIAPPGARLRDTTDIHARIIMTDKDVEVHLPIELPMTGDPGQLVAARARLVMVCTDPAVPGRLKQMRDEANPDQGTGQPPEGIRWTFPWRVERIESDLTRVILRPSTQPPMPSLPTPAGQ